MEDTFLTVVFLEWQLHIKLLDTRLYCALESHTGLQRPQAAVEQGSACECRPRSVPSVAAL